MCSLAAMPADYEMLVSHSPPVFSHSPPLGSGFLGDYSPAAAAGCGGQFERSGYRLSARRPSPPNLTRPRVQLPPASPPTPRAAFVPAPKSSSSSASTTMPVAAPRRPCLVVRFEEAAAHNGTNGTSEELNGGSGDLPSPTRLKKKVVFADDKGLALTQVRVMTEPSNVPPMWSLQFLEQVTKGISAEVAPEPWEVMFQQPASDYLDFRHRLDTVNVSLENVIVRESEEAVVGTVKVRNLCFHKEVLVRSSADGWATQEDAFCTYVNNAGANSAAGYAIYDTFSFRLTLPPRSRRIEFCVCFRCDDGQEFWDNNTGKNYVIVKKPPAGALDVAGGTGGVAAATAGSAAAATGRSDIKMAGKFNDALYAKVDSWSEFASWNHLVNDSPYW